MDASRPSFAPANSAFGLQLEPAPGVDLPETAGHPAAGASPRCTVTLGDCPAPSGPPIFEIVDDGKVGLDLWAREDATYLLRLRAYGTFLLDAERHTITCDPTGPLRWQDALVAQALPLYAVMAGREVFHASAVVAQDATATLIIAPSGTGKSTLAAYLAARGMGFLADDAVAVSLDDGVPIAHAGSRWVQLSATDAGAIQTDVPDATVVGERAGKTTVQLPTAAQAQYPITNLVLLGRDPDVPEPTLEHGGAASPAELLGNSLTQTVRTPRRLIHQLDVCAAIAQRVPVSRVRFGDATGPADLAEHLAEALAIA